MNAPVVAQKSIGNLRQPLPGVIILKGNRLVGEVGAGHDQGFEILQQQVVQRCVRQHHTETTVAGSNISGKSVAGPLPQQDDRSFGALQQACFIRPDDRQFLDGLKILRHQGERLLISLFAPAQLGHSLLVGCIHGKMVASQTLDGDNLPFS